MGGMGGIGRRRLSLGRAAAQYSPPGMGGEISDFAAALVARAEERPDALAFACGVERLTNRRLLEEASRIAAALARRGLEPRDRVALVLPAGLDFVRGFAALALSGAVPFAISPGLAPTILLARAARGRPKLALTTAGLRTDLTARDAKRSFPWVAIEELAHSVESTFSPARVEPEDPAILQLTSGTTGEPRFAVLSHRAISVWRRQAAGPLLPGPSDVLAGWIPPWHVMGLMRFVFLPLVCGAETHLVKPAVQTLGVWLETAERVGATFTAASDFALRTAVHIAGKKRLDLRALRYVATGGEPVRGSTIAAFERRFDLPGVVRPAYGLAEATLAVTSVRLGEPISTDAAGNVSCGRPLPGTFVRIVGERGALCPPGAPGEIHVRSESLFSSYFDDAPDASRRLESGWLATGDWGHLGPDGELFVVGRRRNLLKHGGATFAPRELEEAAERLHGVLGSAAISLARGESEPSVLVVVVEVAHPCDREPGGLALEVAAAIRSEVGFLPGEVIVVRSGTLPRTESGKLRHAELARAFASGALPPERVLYGRLSGWIS